MQRVSRTKFIIFAMIACVVLFCIAAFSVSFAKWTLGDDSNATAEAKGNASNFYVEYPQYVSSAGDVAIPSLDEDKYYLQVPHRDNPDISDYYEMWENDEKKDTQNPEKMVTNVRLYANDTFNVYKGTTQLIIANDNNSTTNVTFDKKTTATEAINGIYTVKTDGYYNLYFDYKWDPWNKMYVGYAGAISSGNNGGTGNTTDTSDYPYNVTFSFSSGSSVKFYFKTAEGAGTGYNNIDTAYMHTWSPDTVAFNIKDKNNLTVALGAKSTAHFMFGSGNSSNWYNYQSAQFDFSEFTASEYLITLHTAKDGDLTEKKAVGGSGGSTVITPATPDITGVTDLSASRETNDKTEVRKVNAVIQQEDNKYLYKNYICVSRKNSEATTADNSIAYLEFRVTDYNVDPYNIIIKSLSLTRRATDARGNITNSFIDPAPRIYNYDPTMETRLGPAETHTAPDPDGNENRYPIFAHGNEHIVTGEGADLEGEDRYANMRNHLDDGVYVVLYFGDNDQQYFALDLQIEFELDSTVTAPQDGVKFTLIADANNINSWERYEDGFGEPWGYYMGGLINSVETWAPNRTTKLTRATDRYAVKYDADKEKDIVTNIDTASATTTSQIATFNGNSTFNYKIIEYWDGEGNREGYARYPKGKIDVSLTVNLTQGSLIKIYMLDDIGSRLDIKDENGNVTNRNRTVYVVPNEIAYDTETKKLFLDPTYNIYDKDLNIIIPKTGTYMFRLVGHFHTSDEDIVDSEGVTRTGSWFKYSDGKRYESLATGQGKELPNFNLIVDTLYITCAGAGNSTCTITLNGNGGTFDGETTVTREVTFGSDITKLPKPAHPDGKNLLGWYYKDSNDEWQEFEFGNTVTGDMSLYARWEEVHTVTFDANGGDLPSGASSTAQTDAYGNLSDEQLSAVEPTLDGYKFKGWYTALTGGTKITTDYTFTASKIVYARWEEANKYKVTFNLNGMPIATVPDQQSITEGGTATQPTVTVPHYTIESWHTGSSCTAANIYDFDTPVTSAKTLYAKWYADDGVYANDVYVGELTTNPKTGVTSTRLMAENVLLKANDTVKFWYNHSQVKSSMFVRSNCPGKNAITPLTTANTDGTLTVKAEDYYSFYYEDNNGTGGTERGIWVTYGGALDATGDGVYVGETKAIAFEAHTEDSQVKAMQYTVTADNTVLTVKFNGYNRIPTANPGSTENPHAFASAGTATGIKLNKGVYDFYYNYVDNSMWIDGYYIVTFDATGGTIDGVATKTITTVKVTSTGGSLKLADIPDEDALYKDGHSFNGWYTAAEGGTKVTLSTTYKFTKSTTLYAQWTQTVFTVTFDLNDGTGTTETIDTDGTSHLTSLPVNPTREGYYFGGWFTSSAVNADESTRITAGATGTKFTRDTTVYAKWQYKVTYDANGGSWDGGATVQSQQVNQGGNAVAPDTNPTHSSKTFAGWYTEAEDGDEFDFDSAVNGNKVLYAHWTTAATTYTITFNANGGTVTPASAKTDTSGKLASLPTPTRNYYKFDGWYTLASGGTQIDEDTVFNGTVTTIYAHWTAKYVMVVDGNIYDLEENTANATMTEYMITDASLAKNATVTFKYGDTSLKLSIGDYSANVLASGTTAVTLSDAGYYSFYIKKEKTANTTTTTWELHSEYSANATGSYDLYIRGTWGTGGEGDGVSWSNRKVASNLKAGDTITFTFKILKSSQFGFMLTNSGTETQTAWGGYSSSAKQITQIHDYSGSNWWTGTYEGRYTFTIKVNSGTSITLNSISGYVAG